MLLKKIKDFLNDTHLEILKLHQDEWNIATMCYFQQPDKVDCRFCGNSFNECVNALKHFTEYELKKKTMVKNDRPLASASYLDINCIPRSMEQLPKRIKKLLNKDTYKVVKKILLDASCAKDDPLNSIVASDVQNVVRKGFPLAKVHPFGSRFVGTANLESDTDIYIDVEGKYALTEYGNKCSSLSPADIKESIESVKNLFLDESDWLVDEACINARVPVLRVRYREYDVKCDLTFSNGLAHQNSMWLAYMFDLQPNSRWLVCYLKKWNPESCLNTYTISLLVIFFFQCRNQLPSVHMLQQDVNTVGKFIDGWNTDFARPTLDQLGYQLCNEAMPSLAHKFFTFYSEQFSLETDIVCPFLGRIGIRKSQVYDTACDKLPPEMSALSLYMEEHQNDPDFKRHIAFNKPFVVQDPFELSHNVAKGVAVDKASKYLRLFELSAKYFR
ncbi:AGAP003771-PA-like protein [Anopheles sinensis]|uniref:AGAP003771-PA-like protein n=1 Tax=Anopheles sinensis TaxID=74873 RepID=A0A084VGL8_ANOSI|nr:AGAP003771-PA-like protein [Anopheles sinensis]